MAAETRVYSGQESLHSRQPVLVRLGRRLRKNRLALVGLTIIVLIFGAGLIGPELSPYDPVKLNIAERFQGPSLRHPFGTDNLGRDLLTRILHGARISLMVSGFSVVFAAAAGITAGLVAGYLGGRVDTLIMRLVDLLLAFPPLLLAIAVAAAAGSGTRSMIAALSVVYTPRIARVTRAAVMATRESDYVTAARALGAGHTHILLRSVFPNCLPVVVVQASLYFAEVVLTEAALTYLGLGEPPPAPTWGNLLNEGTRYMRTAPWMSIFPGLAIALTVLGVNLVGDAVRDTMDPRMRT